MPEIISNTSPLQYLHQLGVLDIFPKLVTSWTAGGTVIVELAVGRKSGLNLPDLQSLDWIIVRRPNWLSRHIRAPNKHVQREHFSAWLS